MINVKWLIALTKCRQIARQMRPSFGRDTLLDMVLLSTSEFDDLMNNDGVFKWDDDYLSSMRLISPWDLANSYQSRTDIERRCLRPSRKLHLLS